MRKYLIAGNWKMNLRAETSVALAKSVADAGSGRNNVDLLVCPTFVYLAKVGEVVEGSSVALGAQDACERADGAMTGEISTGMLQDLRCQYVILGHSERRSLMGETDSTVNAKVNAVLEAGMTPIVCVGESLEEREAGNTLAVVQRQFEQSLDGLSEAQMGNLVIAYEPVWAIGTGKVATPEQAQEVHADLRKMIETRYNPGLAGSVRILYGGSVKPENAAELMSQPDIDGALVGGASLAADQFLAIAAACPA